VKLRTMQRPRCALREMATAQKLRSPKARLRSDTRRYLNYATAQNYEATTQVRTPYKRGAHSCALRSASPSRDALDPRKSVPLLGLREAFVPTGTTSLGAARLVRVELAATVANDMDQTAPAFSVGLDSDR